MNEFLMEIALDIEKLDFKYEYNLKLLEIDMEYTTEFVGFEAIKKLKNGIKYLVNLTYLTINDLIKLNKVQMEKHEVNKMIKFYNKTIKKYPDIGKQKVYVRAYESLKDKYKDYDNKINHNLLAVVKALHDSPMDATLLMGYNMDKASDGYYEMTLNEAIDNLNGYYDSLITETENCKNDIKNLSKDIDRVMSVDVNLFDSVKKLLNNLKEYLVKRSFIFYINLDLLTYQIKHIVSKDVAVKADDVVLDTSKKEDLQKIISDAKKVQTMQVGDLKFNVYQTNYNDISCFNLHGTDIYVTNRFFDLPKGYQLAILYHEIGHTVSGHFFPLEINDDMEKLKTIKKDKRKFYNLLFNSRYSNVEELIDGEELLYIITELDADRYSANLVGKHMMKSSLKSTFNNMLKNSDLSKELIKYNKYRMKLRTSMI